MEDWFRENAADGFNIMSFTYPKELELFVEKVIPVLQQRGLFRKEYQSHTLRGNLNLPIPANRWTRDRQTSS